MTFCLLTAHNQRRTFQGTVNEEVRISWVVFEASTTEPPTLVAASCVLTRSGLAEVVLDAEQKEAKCVPL